MKKKPRARVDLLQVSFEVRGRIDDVKLGSKVTVGSDSFSETEATVVDVSWSAAENRTRVVAQISQANNPLRKRVVARP